MRLVALLLFGAGLLPAQTATFDPQYSYGGLTLWEVRVSGAKANIAAERLWALAASHKVGAINPVIVPILQAKAGKRTGWGIGMAVCTVLGSGTGVAAFIKAQPSFVNNPVATRIAVGGVTAAGVCGVAVPLFMAQRETAPNVSTIGTELVVGSSGSGSGMFWSLQSGDAFTAEVK